VIIITCGNRSIFIHHPVKENILKVNVSQIKGMESMAHLVGVVKSDTEKYEFERNKSVA